MAHPQMPPPTTTAAASRPALISRSRSPSAAGLGRRARASRPGLPRDLQQLVRQPESHVLLDDVKLPGDRRASRLEKLHDLTDEELGGRRPGRDPDPLDALEP